MDWRRVVNIAIGAASVVDSISGNVNNIVNPNPIYADLQLKDSQVIAQEYDSNKTSKEYLMDALKENGLSIQGYEENPTKAIDELKNEVRKQEFDDKVGQMDDWQDKINEENQSKARELEEAVHQNTQTSNPPPEELSDFEKKQQAVDDKYNNQINAANDKYNDKVHTADENYNSKADRINNAPLTDKEKERANSKNIAENYDDKRDANHKRLMEKDNIADQRHNEKQNNIDEQYKNDVAQNYDNHQKEQDKINQDYAEKDKAIDNKYDSKESELRDRTNKDLSSELQSDENKAKFAQNKAEHEGNVDNINSEYDKNAENIKGEYADYKNNTEKQNEMNGRLSENEEGRKSALEKEDANYRDKDKGVINDTEAMKNYNEEHNKNEADRQNEKAENAHECSDKMKDNDKKLEENNEKAKNQHDNRTAENDANLNKEKQNNAEEANKAKEENVADREEKQAQNKAPEQAQSNGQGQGQGYQL